ncbi:Eco57I restriction-modification methylase domain-containing protein [Nocardioides xinjiangensis]|uniref:Eco57I restriction-modification methylase domain-containing protein n=1 Tax=Nocardioides xinjiangensis TaxID=2817376 RepID=UPI001B302FC4|nr:DNA methyltransferase [Nocardioides sp. SYSU D00514]
MRRRTRSVAELHEDWLAQVETDGPFLALPVVKDIWRDGVDRLGDADDRMVTFKQAFVTWQREVDAYALADRTPEAVERYAEVRHAWIDTVLDDLAGWDGLRHTADELPSTFEIRSPGEQVAVRPSGALKGRDAEHAALLLVAEPTTSLRETGLDGWAATEIDRMAMLLRKAEVEVGVVTDGQWWAIVWAKDGKPTGSGMVNALTWAEEPLLRDAFLTLLDQRRFRAKDPDQRLPRLFERSELEAEEITEALGTQVRRSVELLVQSFSEARLAAARQGDPDPLAGDPDDIYQAAVTVMMRVVFLLFAEEREMLPTEQLYWDSYAIRDLLSDLKRQSAQGEEPLDESFDAWHRLLAVSQALYAGVNYDEMRMPAYGGSLLDPQRFPWLHATDERGRLRLAVSDRVMLHVLESVQTVTVRSEQRRVSFRDIDVEQIGYIYEGLLGYSCAVVEDEVIIGLVGKPGEEPEIDEGTLQRLYDDTSDGKTFAAALREWIKDEQPAATPLSVAKLAKLYDSELDAAEEADARRLLTPVAAGDEELLGFLIDWSRFIRRDLRGIPLVIPVGGLVVVETPSRKNAGAHYTPRSLAQEVVLHALQPLVYDPGPLQTNDETAWRLKSSSAILDLKVADIAAGSGAFLVAAARYLADRVAEAWTAEGRLDPHQIAHPQRVKDQAIREVIARCLYGADINPMAVEMCKLSLWLVSMDKTRPFSFVDDKIFCGNSLLGITDLDQLRYLHLYPDPTRMDTQLLVDIDSKIAEATRLRRRLASPVEEHDPMRSTRGKSLLLRQLREATGDLLLVSDGIVASGLPLGARRGAQLDAALKALSWTLGEAFPRDGSAGNRAQLNQRIDEGLRPTVETDYQSWQPLHWVVEAPDVMVDRGGFDAIIGNPPFLGRSKLSGAVGTPVREWLVNMIGEARSGAADLVAYFLLRGVELLRDSANFGLIGTNTIAQGDTREVGLDHLLNSGWTLTRSIQSEPWPAASANLEFAAVWGTNSYVEPTVLRVADGVAVGSISSLLEGEGRVTGNPRRLAERSGGAFLGCYVHGDGFLVAPDLAALWIETDPRNRNVLAPFMNGSDINSRWDGVAPRWVIDFGERSEAEAAEFVAPWRHVEQHVRAERQKRDGKKYPRMVHEWWKFWNPRLGMRHAISKNTRVLVMAQTSNTMQPLALDARTIYSHKVIVFADESFAAQAVLSSSFHFLWARRYASSMRTDISYTPSDVFQTWALPTFTSSLEEAGERLDGTRREVMGKRRIGLTALYNMINDPDVRDRADIKLMRKLHAEVDEATMEAYGWGDVKLNHGFHSYRQMERWTVSPQARLEILDRLLELNHERARAEGQDVPEQGELF